jgi:thiamine-phosphate pyrophosphorylase
MARTLRRPVICLVTSGAVRRPDDPAASDLLTLVTRGAASGVTLVQIREPGLSDRALLTLVRRALEVVDRSRVAVVVNTRTDVALASRADGVHLRGDAMPASRVRTVTPERFLIGRSVHSVPEASDAEADGGADYLIFGTVFASARKDADHPVAGLEALRQVCRSVRLPVIAIGGIDAARAAEVAETGAAGVAAIGMFQAAGGYPDRMQQTVERIRQAFDTP